MSVYAQMPSAQTFLPQICIVLEAVLLKLHVKLAPGWALIRVNFDLIQENGPKVGGGCSFVSGCSFTTLRYCGTSLLQTTLGLIVLISEVLLRISFKRGFQYTPAGFPIYTSETLNVYSKVWGRMGKESGQQLGRGRKREGKKWEGQGINN